MKCFKFTLSMTAIILTTQAAYAQSLTVAGAPLDHLVCYRMQDKLTLQTSTDLIAQLQPDFTQKGCTLIKPIEFCVPATKINVSPIPPNPNIVGTPLKNDYICYLAKCANQIPPPDKKVIDQFGSRVQQNYHLSKVCVPAQKAPEGCPTGPIVTGGPTCAGACPNRTDLCKIVKLGGVKTCSCVAVNKACGGKPDAAGMCGGDCTTPGDVCVLKQVIGTTGTVSVKCACDHPKDPICSRDAATGACGGACPSATDKCVSDPLTGQCDCQPASPPCQVTGANATGPTCGGVCPLPGQTCTLDATTTKCSCNPPAGCAQDPTTGACGGTCPSSGMSCTLDSTGKCSCQDTPCGSINTTTPPSCGGACPLAFQQCLLTATGACNCVPANAPCQGNTATGMCGGTCGVDPNGVQLICRNIPGTPGCSCQ
ncbi:MAG: hypothetical protein HY270_02795 [Deltaproteobacteria bacterium]|nr:hypothetical protein [Deltaproteobacteria bacterium]